MRRVAGRSCRQFILDKLARRMVRTNKILKGVGAATLIMWAYMLWWAIPAHAAAYDVDGAFPDCVYTAGTDTLDCDAWSDIADFNLSGYTLHLQMRPYDSGTYVNWSNVGPCGSGFSCGSGTTNGDWSDFVSSNPAFVGVGHIRTRVCAENGGSPVCESSLGDFYLTPPGAPDDPTVSVTLPAATTYGALGVPFRFATNVCEQDYPDETVTVEWDIEQDDGGWVDVFSGTTSQSSFLVDDAGTCASGMFYGVGGLPDPKLPHVFISGDYRIRVRAQFTGEAWSAYSSYTEFTVANTPFGGGGGGSWGGGTADSGDGSSEDWNDFFDGVPTHDDQFGACDFWGSDATDGLPCLWSWVRYALIPPADATFNFIKRPFDVLMTRWPLSYVTTTWDSLLVGLSGDGDCPIPTFLAADPDMLGEDLPMVDVCGWLDPIGTYIDDSAFASAAFVFFLWCVFVAFCVEEALKFFE